MSTQRAPDRKNAAPRSAGAGTGRKPTAKATSETPRIAEQTPSDGPAKPYGSEEVIEAIIEATVSLWTDAGPAGLSLRKIAARAGVNYGLVYRHFGTKDALIRAAIDRHSQLGRSYIEDAPDLTTAVETFLGETTGSFARLLAWANLQGVTEVAWPDEYPSLDKLRELAAVQRSDLSAASVETRVLVGSLMAMMYGWRFFEEYLTRGLGLTGLDRETINASIKPVFAAIIENSYRKG
jgi:AcrR family transcriptional regulator